jgi:hypothetical protein
MPVKTGGVEPAKGKWRVYWWFMVVFALACIAGALISGRPVLGSGALILVYPLQRLFWSTPGTDPSKTGLQRARERLGSGAQD